MAAVVRTAISALYSAAISGAAVNSTAATVSANPNPSNTPVTPAARARTKSRAPSACPTSTPQALPSDSGSMNINAARLAAIWCEAEVTAPRRATNNAMKVNAVTSTKKVTPIGSPSDTISRNALRSGHDQRANTW